MSLGSNGVDRERSLRKFLIRHRGTNFCINCTSLECFASSLCSSSIMVPNAPKKKETHENMSLGSNYGDQVHSFWEILTRLCGTNFCFNCTRLAHFAPSFVQYPNGLKCTQMKKMHQNMSLGSNGVDREHSLQKILTRHRCTNFCISCTSLARFAPSFV